MEFLKEFDINKKYVFDKDIYIEYMNTIGSYTGDNRFEEYWTDGCNNKEVSITNKDEGIIVIGQSGFKILPCWCREIPSIRLLTEEDML